MPFLGMLIVWIIGMFNIYRIKKNRLYVALFYLITIVPAILFCGIFMAVYLLGIMPIDNITLKIVLAFILGYIIYLCMAIAIICVQKQMIERFKKQEEKQIENNLQ